jgi:hypothetical protein
MATDDSAGTDSPAWYSEVSRHYGVLHAIGILHHGGLLIALEDLGRWVQKHPPAPEGETSGPVE